MPISDVTFTNLYRPIFEAANNSGDVVGQTVQPNWGSWWTQGTVGMEVVPPWSSSVGLSSVLLPPGDFGSGLPITVATNMAAAWKTWFLLTTWTIPPPLPPFSAITSVVSSSTGATTQEAILITALTAEFFLPAPPEPNAAWAAKAAAFEVLFAAAIRSAGVDIIGIGLAPVFPPVILPGVAIL